MGEICCFLFYWRHVFNAVFVHCGSFLAVPLLLIIMFLSATFPEAWEITIFCVFILNSIQYAHYCQMVTNFLDVLFILDPFQQFDHYFVGFFSVHWMCDRCLLVSIIHENCFQILFITVNK